MIDGIIVIKIDQLLCIQPVKSKSRSIDRYTSIATVPQSGSHANKNIGEIYKSYIHTYGSTDCKRFCRKLSLRTDLNVRNVANRNRLLSAFIVWIRSNGSPTNSSPSMCVNPRPETSRKRSDGHG